MNLETPVEYFYGESLRWSFGFDNPNKAAVLFVCAVPLLWGLWLAAWRIGHRGLRLPALVLAAGLLAGAWYGLIMTYSRGGLVAAVVAMMYLVGVAAWHERRAVRLWLTKPRVWVSSLLVMVLLGGTIWNGLGNRAAEALGTDASVGNRIELWGSALQMAVENPQGFGSGKSGEQYMQWYQPLERQQGYRTMVNSYLTYLVEHGWGRSILILLGFTLFWVWTKPGRAEPFPFALRASILGFLVAGIFSTTMEDGRLWVFPAGAGIALAALAFWHRRTMARTPLILTGTAVLAGCAVLAGEGLRRSHHDPLRREFGEIGGGRSVTALGPANSNAPTLGCVVDEMVMGDTAPKLWRELALGTGNKILLGARVNEAERILCVGQAVHSSNLDPAKPLLLLAPLQITDAELAAMALRSVPVHILMPEIDEDGRVAYWQEITAGKMKSHFQMTSLSGVGNRVDWAWDQVVECVKGG